MKTIGILCEYNPFHNGHLYHIKKAKELFPDSILILVLNGYFLERGEISLLSKEDKTQLALFNGVDLVLELPVVFGTQSADIFAEKAFFLFHHFGVTDVIFGSESNDISFLMNLAKKQMDPDYDIKVQKFLKEGINYPTALNKAFNNNQIIDQPNDLLGISYAKIVLKKKYAIQLHTIKRTNDFHDIKAKSKIVSASNIREKISHGEDISPFLPTSIVPCLKKIDEEKLWTLLKFRLLTDPHLSLYMTVDEGLESRIERCAFLAHDFKEFLRLLKTKRYTYNRLRRMCIHILLGFTKEDNKNLEFDYFHILGFNQKGQEHLAKLRKTLPIPFQKKDSKIWKYEKKAALLYEELTNSEALAFELKNKPIQK